MNYHLLMHDHPNSGFIDADVVFSPALPEYYRVGLDIGISAHSVDIKMDKAVRKLKVDFFLATCGAFFASNELAGLIKSYQNDVVLVQAKSTYNNGQPTEKQYCLIHVNNRLDCLDYHRSEYPGKASFVKKIELAEAIPIIKTPSLLAIDKEKANKHHFFFVDNVVLIDPIISDELLIKINKSRFIIHSAPVQ